MYNYYYYYVGTYYMYGVLRFRNFLRTPEYSGGSGVVLYYTSVPRCKSRQRSRASHRAACRKRAVKCAIANGGAAVCWPVATALSMVVNEWYQKLTSLHTTRSSQQCD